MAASLTRESLGRSFFEKLESSVNNGSALEPKALENLRLEFLVHAKEYIESKITCKIEGLDANLLGHEKPCERTILRRSADEFVIEMIELIRDMVASTPERKGSDKEADSLCLRIETIVAFALRLCVLAVRRATVSNGLVSLWELFSDSTHGRAVHVDLSTKVLYALRCIFRPRRHPMSYFIFSGKPLFPLVRRSLKKDGYSFFSWIRLEDEKEGKHNFFSFVDKSGTGVQYFIKNNALRARTLVSGSVKPAKVKLPFQKGRWYSIAAVHSSSNSIRIYANGELCGTAPLPYPPISRGQVQYSVGGFHGCMAGFHVFDQCLRQIKARQLHCAGPDFFPSTHRLKDGPVILLPQIPCIHGLQKRGSAITRRTQTRILVRYVFGLTPELFADDCSEYAPVGWETLDHYGQKVRFSADKRSEDGVGGVRLHISPNPYASLMRLGGMNLILHISSPGGILGDAGIDEEVKEPSLDAGEVISLIADLLAFDPKIQSQYFRMGPGPLRTAILNYTKPSMSSAHGVASVIMGIEDRDLTPSKLHLTEAVMALMDFTYWSNSEAPPEAMMRLLRLFESLVERYPKPFAVALGPVRTLDWLRLVCPSAFTSTTTAPNPIGVSEGSTRSARSSTTEDSEIKSETSGATIILNSVVYMIAALEQQRQQQLAELQAQGRTDRKIVQSEEAATIEHAVHTLVEAIEAISKLDSNDDKGELRVRILIELVKTILRLLVVARDSVLAHLNAKTTEPELQRGGSGRVGSGALSTVGGGLAKLGMGLGGLFADVFGDNQDDADTEKQCMEGGAAVVFIELLSHKDDTIRQLAANVLMEWARANTVFEDANPDAKHIEGSTYPIPRVKAESEDAIGITSTLYKKLKMHGNSALNDRMREVMMAWAMGTRKVAETGDMVEVQEKTRIRSPAMLVAILHLGSVLPGERQEQLLLDVFTCLRAHRSCLLRLVSEQFWQRSLVPYLYQNRHAALFALHIAHHTLRYCVVTFKNGWLALSEMRWSILHRKSHEEQTKQSSSEDLIIWRQVLFGTLSALLPTSGQYKGSLTISNKAETYNVVKENLVPTMHMVEEALFNSENVNFDDGCLPNIVIEEDAGDESEDSKRKSKDGTPLKQRNSMQKTTNPIHVRESLLLILLVGVMEHFPMPARRQDVLRVLLRYLRYLLPHKEYSSIVPHILGYTRQLFKLRLVKRSHTNIRTLALALCLVRDAMVKVGGRLDAKAKAGKDRKDEISDATKAAEKMENKPLGGEEEEVNLADMQRCITELFMLWRGSLLACFPDTKSVVDEVAKGAQTNKESLGVTAVKEALAVVDAIRSSEDYTNYVKLCRDHEAWFDRVMAERQTKENKSILTLCKTHKVNFPVGTIAAEKQTIPKPLKGLYGHWQVTSPIAARQAMRRRAQLTKGPLSKALVPGSGPGGTGKGLCGDGEWEWGGRNPALLELQTFCAQYDAKLARSARRLRRRKRFEAGESLNSIVQRHRAGTGKNSSAETLLPIDRKEQDQLEGWCLSPVEDSYRIRTLFSRRMRRKPPEVVDEMQVDAKASSLKDVDVKTFSTAGVVRESNTSLEEEDDQKQEKTIDREPTDDNSEALDMNETTEDTMDEDNLEKKTHESRNLYGSVQIEVECIVITTLKKMLGKLIVTKTHIIFRGQRMYEDCSTGVATVSVTHSVCLGFPSDDGAGAVDGSDEEVKKTEVGTPAETEIIISNLEVRQAMPRLYLLQNTAMEIFLKDHTSLFFNFHENSGDRNRVFQLICSTMRLPYELSAAKRLRHSGIVSQWQNGEISNFQYIMHVNTIAGRTFNDVSQYPIFPWILQDYTSATLDLANPKVYRDLSKPIGALNPARLEAIDERFENPLPDVPAFHYGSHYSSPGIVNYFLVRVEPYSTLALAQQGGRFDLPDRLFDSVQRAWHLSFTQISDVKELIPEFYSNSVFLKNVNNLNLGKKQNGRPVGDVELPPWAKGSPETFISIQRDALESDIVSQRLHLWIDLIFGSRQKGPGALEAKNLFYYLTYPGQVDVSMIEDPKTREATLAQISSFGQTPSQLFTTPHASKTVSRQKNGLQLPHVLPPHYSTVRVWQTKRPLKQIGLDKRGQICFVTSLENDNLPTARELLLVDLSGIFDTVVETAVDLTGDVTLAENYILPNRYPRNRTKYIRAVKARSSATSNAAASQLRRISVPVSSSSTASSATTQSSSSSRFSVQGIFSLLTNKNRKSDYRGALEVIGPAVLQFPRWLSDRSFHKSTTGGVTSPISPSSSAHANSSSWYPTLDRTMAISKNNQFIFVGGQNDKCFRCYLREAKRMTLLSQIAHHSSQVSCVRIAMHQNALITADCEGEVCIWNTALRSHQWKRSPISLEPSARFHTHDGMVLDCDVHVKAGVAVSVGRCRAIPDRNCVCVYSTHLNRCVNIIEPPPGCSPVRVHLIAQDRGPITILILMETLRGVGNTKQLDTESVIYLYSLPGHVVASREMGEIVSDITVTPRSDFIACGAVSGEVVFLKARDLSLVQAIGHEFIAETKISRQPLPSVIPEDSAPETSETCSEPVRLVSDRKSLIERQSSASSIEAARHSAGSVVSIKFSENEQYCIVAFSSGAVHLMLLPETDLLPGLAAFVTSAQQVSSMIESQLDGSSTKDDEKEKLGEQSKNRLEVPSNDKPKRASLSNMMRGIFGRKNSNNKQG